MLLCIPTRLLRFRNRIAAQSMTWSETVLISGVSLVLAAIATVFIMSGVHAALGV
jgi:hypothetical protein